MREGISAFEQSQSPLRKVNECDVVFCVLRRRIFPFKRETSRGLPGSPAHQECGKMVAPGRAMLALALAVAVTPGPARRHEAFSRRQAQAGAAPYTKGEPVTAEAIR